MKIGTDAVLLGSWTPLHGAKHILDVGTGCGIVALMLAQRSESIGSTVAAIDIDPAAAQQALDNFVQSPWPDRLPSVFSQIHKPLQQMDVAACPSFDLIVCNPPFFEPSPQLKASSRKLARATETLDRMQLYQGAKSLLAGAGRLSMIIPFDQAENAIDEAAGCGFQLVARTDVRPTPDSILKRSLLEFSLGPIDAKPARSELIVETSRHVYSEQYRALTKDFHLRYA